MNAKIKKRWIEALRSGKYKQGIRALKPTRDTYCCLGVLCKVMGARNWTEEYTLPSHIYEKAGLNDEDPRIKWKGKTTLATLNDEGMSFKQIANIIEKQL